MKSQREKATAPPASAPVVSGVLQRSATNSSPIKEVPTIVQEVLQSPGQPLEPGARALMESRFGHDFSKVRVHTDSRAAESARAVNALAYTVEQDMVFDAGQYEPSSTTGQALLAHELTHTLQQRNASGGNINHSAAEAEAHQATQSFDQPLLTSHALQVGNHPPGLYRQAVGGAAPTATAIPTGVDTGFERTMRERYQTTTIQTGTQDQQTLEVASRIHQLPASIVLPGWQSWNPGAGSLVYSLILESLQNFQNALGGVPRIQKVIFFQTEYAVHLDSAGAAITTTDPNVGATFGAGVLTIYQALTNHSKTLPVARSTSPTRGPRARSRATTATVGANPDTPTSSESIRRFITHELGHGLAEAAMNVDPNTFNDYRKAVGWTANNPSRLFDIGQPTVQAALSSSTLPLPQFEITVNNWNLPQWREQPVSRYMVLGGPGEDFAEAVMTFIRAPNLLLARSPQRFQFLHRRQKDWLPALLRVPDLGDFPPPRGDQRVG